MSDDKKLIETVPPRPDHVPVTPVPPVPNASTEFAHYQTELSGHRTGLSEHRTSLSEYRTDLSMHRTDLSTDRTDMSMRRTGMSFQRTRMSAERTLMSVIRTSLSLISFGFTIFQFLQKLKESDVITGAAAARNFGMTLVLLGVGMLVFGIAYHIQFMVGLRHERNAMVADGLIYGQSKFPPSITLLTAVILLVIGVFAIVGMAFHAGPFG